MNVNATSFYPNKNITNLNTQNSLISASAINLQTSLPNNMPQNTSGNMLDPTMLKPKIFKFTDKDVADYFSPKEISDIIYKTIYCMNNIKYTEPAKKTIISLIPYIKEHKGKFLTKDIDRIVCALNELRDEPLKKEVTEALSNQVKTPPGFRPFYDNEGYPIQPRYFS